MKLIIVTPTGELVNEEVDYVVVSSKANGEFAIMKDHIPIISSIDIGYVKMVRDSIELYTVIINGVVEHSDNIINVIAQEAHVGLSKESALDHLSNVRTERTKLNKQRNVDFTKVERELKKNIKDAKAGKL